MPSTVNRVYAWARPDSSAFGLNYASSFVLPLQGFWNSLIYVSMSWPVFKSVLALKPKLSISRHNGAQVGRTGTGSRDSVGNESVQELTV